MDCLIVLTGVKYGLYAKFCCQFVRKDRFLLQNSRSRHHLRKAYWSIIFIICLGFIWKETMVQDLQFL